MSKRLLVTLLPLLIAAVFTFVVPPAASPSSGDVFIDLDGDGFDDNAPDDDTDGIPDEYERHRFISAPQATLGVSNLFSGNGSQVTAPARPRCGESFGRRKFAVRAVSENRLDFDIGFGSNLGLGSGLGSGGGCAGGVCF